MILGLDYFRKIVALQRKHQEPGQHIINGIQTNGVFLDDAWCRFFLAEGFGVGLSPWPEDFVVTGSEWKARGARMDEMIEIIRGLCTGEYFEFHGTHYELPSIKICPVPTEPLPILIGGHAEPALRRAARIGDGWMHAGSDAQTLEGLLGRISELRTEYGREREPFEVHVISMDAYSIDGVKRLEDVGVTDAIVGFRNAYEVDTQTLDHKIDALRRFADDVIAKV